MTSLECSPVRGAERGHHNVRQIQASDPEGQRASLARWQAEASSGRSVAVRASSRLRRAALLAQVSSRPGSVMRRIEEPSRVPWKCVCESCKANRREPHALRHAEVHSYTYKPSGDWKPKAKRGERIVAAPLARPSRPHSDDDVTARHAERGGCYQDYSADLGYTSSYSTRLGLCGRCRGVAHAQVTYDFLLAAYHAQLQAPLSLLPPTYYIGIELETKAPGRYDPTPAPLSGRNAFAADMRRPKNHWVAKHDGSVSGPEFASQPATLAWWYAHRADVTDMFTMLLHAGYRSHEGDTAGMHVNVSHCAFASAEHVSRFCALLASNTQWALRMSQRTEKSMRDWARIDGYKDAYHRDRWADRAFNENHSADGRYVALNVPDENRFEFRLPRGTLRVDRFYKNIEWTTSMIEYTRHADEAACTPPLYMASILRDKAYPDLRAFIVDRFQASIQKSSECREALAVAV